MTKRRTLVFEQTKTGCLVCVSHKATRKIRNAVASVYKFEGRSWLLHRFIYTQLFGQIPEGKVVRHMCNNGRCCNVEHMVLGTQKENAQDMIDSGRNTNGPRTLDEQKAMEIRDLANRGPYLQKDVAKMYGVSTSAVSAIKNNRYWTPENLERRANKKNEGELIC